MKEFAQIKHRYDEVKRFARHLYGTWYQDEVKAISYLDKIDDDLAGFEKEKKIIETVTSTLADGTPKTWFMDEPSTTPLEARDTIVQLAPKYKQKLMERLENVVKPAMGSCGEKCNDDDKLVEFLHGQDEYWYYLGQLRGYYAEIGNILTEHGQSSRAKMVAGEVKDIIFNHADLRLGWKEEVEALPRKLAFLVRE